MRRLLTVLIVTCTCAVLLAACTERSKRSSADSASAPVNFSDTTPQVSESDTSSKMPVVSSPASGTSGTAASHEQSEIAPRIAAADAAYSGEWISKGVTSLYDQGGYSLTLVIHADGTASGSLGHASYHIGHEADADFTGTVRSHVVTAAYRDDGWGHAGMLKMELSNGEIHLTVTPEDSDIASWQLGGGEMPVTLVRDTAKNSPAG